MQHTGRVPSVPSYSLSGVSSDGLLALVRLELDRVRVELRRSPRRPCFPLARRPCHQLGGVEVGGNETGSGAQLLLLDGFPRRGPRPPWVCA